MSIDRSLRHYLVVTAAYWGFTITDGALRMLVVLHFHALGYSPLEIAMLFLFYEFFGIVTNLTGGWLGARLGLNRTLQFGIALQILALGMLMAPVQWLTVPYVMLAQALSGIAKDLNKMSAKAGVKAVFDEAHGSALFGYVAALTGSKNALKGGGFFVGAALLQWFGLRVALGLLVAALLMSLTLAIVELPRGLGRMQEKPKFSQMFAHAPAVNWLAAARLFLFGARDLWFVVGLPVFLSAVLGWAPMRVGGALALWVIGYGAVQAVAPRFLRGRSAAHGPGGRSARTAALCLAGCPAAIAVALAQGVAPALALGLGLTAFGVVFALNSALHSYLVLAYTAHDRVAMSVGFYYMANAAGRLLGTVLSGLVYQTQGLTGCLWWSSGFVVLAFMLSWRLPELAAAGATAAVPQGR